MLFVLLILCCLVPPPATVGFSYIATSVTETVHYLMECHTIHVAIQTSV